MKSIFISDINCSRLEDFRKAHKLATMDQVIAMLLQNQGRIVKVEKVISVL